ncbi:hypothetical protein SAMN05445504_3623 [Burkholderia sp. CF099]|nr:hypothetical protein SAMN05445504_3623 [Burkholderia sp. CF099]
MEAPRKAMYAPIDYFAQRVHQRPTRGRTIIEENVVTAWAALIFEERKSADFPSRDSAVFRIEDGGTSTVLFNGSCLSDQREKDGSRAHEKLCGSIANARY